MDFKPFRAVRPREDVADLVAAPPYDVLDDKKARELGQEPKSIVHITRSEINFPEDQNPYDKIVYENAKETLDKFIKDDILVREDEPSFYIYREIIGDRSQVGIVGTISTKDYELKNIKKHELTLEEKLQDRINHFYYTNCHTESVFLFYEKNEELSNIVSEVLENDQPIIDFVDPAGVRQILYRISDESKVSKISDIFKTIDELYIADGHHRTESTYQVSLKKDEELGEKGEHNYLLATIFQERELNIMSYNRVVADLNGLSRDEFLKELSKNFHIEEIDEAKTPNNKHEFTILLGDRYFNMRAKEELYKDKNIVDQLDVSIIGKYVLEDILGIVDIRRDSRIDFYGGFNAIDEIKERINNDMELGLILYPVSASEIREISDERLIMPPKSTWFEPKIISGLFMHEF